ncbi:MAG: fatty acid desaturase [Candidatus Omnitrophica bacterium]|nr:fatty acid desaturase [Candidatus Omnitrophota bacterium]
MMGSASFHPWLALAYVAITGHITITCVSLYLHRAMAHRSLTLHPLPAACMRVWLWMFTGMYTKEWTACHRKHHAFTDQEGDPHSPKNEGFWQVLLAGVIYYQRAVADEAMVEKYGRGTPDDWLERRVFRQLHLVGIFSVLLVDSLLFGSFLGLGAWAIQMAWTPLFAAGVINGAGHAIGYRNFGLQDTSRNLLPWGVWIAGEELHNNHHANPASPKFSVKWWEYDVSWTYISVLKAMGLASVIEAATPASAAVPIDLSGVVLASR